MLESNKYIKETLNPKLWDGFQINQDIRKRLLKIAKEFCIETKLEEKTKVKDVVLVGSSCNYNWHKGSDLDLHIILDFSKIDENIELVKEYLASIRKDWNDHHDITLKGLDVEISIQDYKEDVKSGGIFSLLDNTWLIRPDKKEVSDETLKERDNLVEPTSTKIMNLERKFLIGKTSTEILYKEADELWKYIKKLRKDGLEKSGEFDPSNLAFKKLRDKGFIEKLVTLKNKIYDKHFSK